MMFPGGVKKKDHKKGEADAPAGEADRGACLPGPCVLGRLFSIQ